jgi:hypothetical protein
MEDLVLFGTAGFQRGRGWGGALGHLDSGNRKKTVYLSKSLVFEAPDGASVTVTSERPAAHGPSSTAHGPLDGQWEGRTVLVDGRETVFEVCHLQQGRWVAVGRLTDAVVTVESRGVPLDAVQLERVPAHVVPALPDLGAASPGLVADLDDRFKRLPLRRVHSIADYWALRSVEVDHVRNLARRLGLSGTERLAVQGHWLGRVDGALARTIERLQLDDLDAATNSRTGRRLKDRNAVRQVWWNTLGPGATTWFNNRYAPVRRHTFRLHWRP